jgi:hypothetical protein
LQPQQGQHALGRIQDEAARAAPVTAHAGPIYKTADCHETETAYTQTYLSSTAALLSYYLRVSGIVSELLASVVSMYLYRYSCIP